VCEDNKALIMGEYNRYQEILLQLCSMVQTPDVLSFSNLEAAIDCFQSKIARKVIFGQGISEDLEDVSDTYGVEGGVRIQNVFFSSEGNTQVPLSSFASELRSRVITDLHNDNNVSVLLFTGVLSLDGTQGHAHFTYINSGVSITVSNRQTGLKPTLLKIEDDIPASRGQLVDCAKVIAGILLEIDRQVDQKLQVTTFPTP